MQRILQIALKSSLGPGLKSFSNDFLFQLYKRVQLLTNNHHHVFDLVHVLLNVQDIKVPSVAFDTHASFDEVVDAYIPCALNVKHVEEFTCLLNIHVHDCHVPQNILSMAILFELLPSDEPCVIYIYLIEDLLQIHAYLPYLTLLGLNDKIAIHVTQLTCSVYKDTCKDIEHTEHHKEDVKSKEAGMPSRDNIQWIDKCIPIQTT
mmetsp:Transcript_121523/g.214988  ORF Transcript_121523/g.214988 Transcript_121523/m.214988 type:complete len:205 (+) Transcript_121523:24-638(+)